MQRLSHKNPTYQLQEVFFVEKVVELLHRMSIDTYRSMSMNPRTILVELNMLLRDERIVNNKAISYAIDEARILLMEEDFDIIKYGSISKGALIGLLSAIEKATGNDVYKAKQRASLAIEALVLVNNKGYGLNLLVAIEAHLAGYNTAASAEEIYQYFEKLQRLITHFTTELISHGYSKSFLYRFFSNNFVNKSAVGTAFSDGIKNVTGLLTYSEKAFEVVFKISLPSSIADEITFLEPAKIKLAADIDDIVANYPAKINPQVSSFPTKGIGRTKFLRICTEALDSFTALDKARAIMAENLDLIHLGYSNDNVFPENQVLIVESLDAGKFYFQVRALHYEMDGDFRNGEDLYKRFSDCLHRITSNSSIVQATKEKIKSAIRYLRLGNEALEIEHKFLNYWIAMEYLFAGLKDRSDINDIKTYFSRIHANIYIKRLLNDLNNNLHRLRLATTLPNYLPASLDYLMVVDAYDKIINDHSTDFPLLAHRAIKLKKVLFPPAPANPPAGKQRPRMPIEFLMHRHIKHLELHLSRMYRIRNTIIHNAAINMDIISTTASLRYYLTFILSAAIKELTENGNLTSIEDFFLTQDITFDSLQDENFPIDKLLALGTHFEFLV